MEPPGKTSTSPHHKSSAIIQIMFGGDKVAHNGTLSIPIKETRARIVVLKYILAVLASIKNSQLIIPLHASLKINLCRVLLP
jgi:hypothetical protein